MLHERRILMDIFDKFAEMVVKFVRKYVVKFVVNKLLDWIWKKIKPKLLKAARKLCQILKDRLQKVKKKWLELKQKKRANVHETLTLIFINEYRHDNHSCEVMIMITVTQKYMIIIVVTSLK